MSLDYALPKKFPHKLALIDVQFFLENVSTHYLRHVLFVWRLLTWKKKRNRGFKGACRMVKAAAFCAFGKLSAVFLCWRARRRSAVKGKFMVALGTTVLAMFTWSLHVLQAACKPVTLSSSIRNSALQPKWSRISQRGCMTSTDPRLWAKCWTRKCKKKKVSTFTVCYASTCVCTCDVCTPASIYIDQRKARFHKNKVRIWILFFFFKLCRENMT